MRSLFTRAVLSAAIAAVALACTAAGALAGVTVTPAGTLVVAYSAHTTFTMAAGAVSFECFDNTAVTDIPSVPDNTTLSPPLLRPVLLGFNNCQTTFGGSTVPVNVTTGTGHTIDLNQDHSVTLGIVGGQIVITIPLLGCSETIGATTVPTIIDGTLTAVTGFAVNTTIPVSVDGCGFGSTGTFQTLTNDLYDLYLNAGTESAPDPDLTDPITISITDLA